MHQLVPCSGCDRHVRADEPACPFCGEAPSAAARRPSARRVPERAGRAAMFAFGAALAAASSGCGQSHGPTEDAGATEDAGPAIVDAGVDSGVDAGVDAGSVIAAYGTPAIDAGPIEPEDAGFFPPYGTPPEEGDHSLL